MKIFPLKVDQDRLKEYVSSNGISCPRCNSDQIESTGQIIESGAFFSRTNCLHCGELWEEVYYLVGIDMIENTGRLKDDLSYREKWAR